jgi:hypothetical protein
MKKTNEKNQSAIIKTKKWGDSYSLFFVCVMKIFADGRKLSNDKDLGRSENEAHNLLYLHTGWHGDWGQTRQRN